jgi:hypothetical protein
MKICMTMMRLAIEFSVGVFTSARKTIQMARGGKKKLISNMLGITVIKVNVSVSQ